MSSRSKFAVKLGGGGGGGGMCPVFHTPGSAPAYIVGFASHQVTLKFQALFCKSEKVLNLLD